ncbi:MULTISPECIES: hypothetical protein [Saccharopolyspora]|uniref:WXG100 family type VII secretion target n=1 Tax=Saccharopolyspora gregorii TaxID=33914 RepID=A0ABP6RQ97_9PSEU|nr:MULTISPECIES: hypothetical protein [Saccharopolyspora]MCA1190454.1 hypothetical protein [Saccharopolyspora sp. 6T]MCA1196291.1 hypothetical protein [Saccharopolyspora sp. 6V]MCA1228493.1 hypothetical protein [Saccharopolyspora sp. 6M]MCA1283336.1 hypothetical protein [Saccharopolyspora sp. 7B]
MTAALTAFPDREAAIVVEYAEKTGRYVIVRVIDEIRDWLGHPEVVMDIAQAWSPAAKAGLLHADDTIVEARTSISGNWSGPAATSYLTYLDHVSKVMLATGELFDEFSGKMLDIRQHITDAYKEAIGIIGNTGAEILSMTGGIVAGAKELLFGVADAVLEALANFLRLITSTAQNIVQIMTDFQRSGLELAQRAADLQIPEALPSVVADSGNWKAGSA